MRLDWLQEEVWDEMQEQKDAERLVKRVCFQEYETEKKSSAT